ncbi:hypothetical protein F2P56_006798 [Juglans regia]|uniref:Uncharacterized protein LOC108996843 isoform X2 n=2 Tax=Juglans regia TaxID=51240 RepID=A0A2I4F9V7_JUGRE|nr:uncharacterized protein LOC108996843 isoform X2 [Juglans regia]XP_018828424.1 uncharacterized protein LOC108996843 isoform X2 [Juglans regia]KAF5474946.1 hypothetical protein F2P56_006798 [Juglans regia]
MEEVSERSELRRMQREQERERRRMRDRQRRQSMTLEQREKHLARRRRNYQLRRLRAESARSGSQTGQAGMVSRGETITSDEHQAVTSFSGLSVKCNGVTHVGTNKDEENLTVDCKESEGLEALAYKGTNFPRRLRLSHIRHLARSLNNSMGELGGNHQMVEAVITKRDVASNCLQVGRSDSGISPQSLRLNRVKRLARTFNNSANSATREASDQDHRSATEVEQKLPCGELQLISNDEPKLV